MIGRCFKLKIVYIVKTKLHYYPPCVSQIRMIKRLNYDIDVLYGTSDESALKLLKSEKINCKKVGNISDEYNSFLKKILSWLKFRHHLKKELKKYPSNTLLWFGTGESVLPMLGCLKRNSYVVSFLELYDEFPFRIKLFANIAKKALAVTVCEIDRAYIMQYWWKLDKLPYVFPNKPYDLIRTKNAKPSIKEVKELVNGFKNSKIILYQGIIQNSEELIEIAKALNHTKNHYKFVLMGIDKYKSISVIKKYYSDIEYIEYIPAPYHLEITNCAHIGITFYRPDSLNKVYCAPNKIYEYTGFGVPVLCNNIPGLNNTIGNFKAGICVNMKENNIATAIDKIESDYHYYSSNAIRFFDNTDNYSRMEELLNSIKKQ